MNLSYLITVHNETKTLNNLLERIIDYCQDEDQIIILDDFSDNEETLEILNKCFGKIVSQCYFCIPRFIIISTHP